MILECLPFPVCAVVLGFMDPSRMRHDQAGVSWISVLLFPSHAPATASNLVSGSPKVVGASP